MKTTYNEIVSTYNHSIPTLIELAEAEQLLPASSDTKKVLLLIIDPQNDFIEGGTLAVPGAAADMERLTSFMYHNLSKITQVICSLDTHSPEQIFHACWWKDASGNQPTPFTIITHHDVVSGKWIPIRDNAKTIEYLKNLEYTGKKQLCIWPYHCLAGTHGANMYEQLTSMLYFHAAARKSTPILVEKGQDPLTEMYGIIKAEYDTTAYVNTAILEAVEQYDEIYVAGEAASHCVLASIGQIAEHYADKPHITKRISLLSDCTSSIPGFEDATSKAFDDLIKQYSIQLVKTTNTTI